MELEAAAHAAQAAATHGVGLVADYTAATVVEAVDGAARSADSDQSTG